MAIQKIDKETKRAILDARRMIEDIIKSDANEAETRRRVERTFDSLMGYDVFANITREKAVKGVGDADYCDFAIVIDQKPIIVVEIKRVNVDLAQKHLKQASSYAINEGCEWVLLTNGKEWQLHHILFGQPPETKQVLTWNLITDDPKVIAKNFETVGFKNVKKGGLDSLWKKCDVLSPRNLLEILLSEDSIRLIAKKLRREADLMVLPEEVVVAFRRLLNEAANNEIDDIKIYLPKRKERTLKKDEAQSNSSDGAVDEEEAGE